MFFSKKFVLTGDSGQEIGAVVLEHLWADVYGIAIRKSEFNVSADLWAKEISIALSMAERLSARQVLFRLITDKNSAKLSQLLQSLGFHRKQDRVEYKKSLEDLPDDTGSPLLWKSAEQLGWTANDIAKILVRIADGDPGHDPSEDPLQFIQDFLADPVLTAGLGCIHIGFIAEEITAMTVVQINPKSGWSRISYMGVMPKFRRSNFGKWVHRYSFTQMKKQGGKLYHGGTAASNKPMIRLFEVHGCNVFCKMEEWVYATERGQL